MHARGILTAQPYKITNIYNDNVKNKKNQTGTT